MNPTWSLPFFAVSVPLTLGLGAALVPTRALAWARRVTLVAGTLSVLAVVLAALAPAPAEAFARIDVPAAAMLLLVALLGVVVSHYSERYLAGEPGLRRYARALLLTLSAVTALLITHNLAVMAMAWMVTSLAVHQLLTFYPDRRPALIAAHKKFIVSRAADVCLAAALALIGLSTGTLELDGVVRALNQAPALAPMLSVAAVLAVVAVALKSAQLPFHGWLTQVMEAPTPVSALLHAGVVNLGGFFLLRLAPLLERAPVAMALLFALGLASALFGGLVMMTRVSIKLSLAWSTCAQLGFMLLQCSLGAWDLALLHLVAHSLYKAHAFLNAGNTVEAWRVRSQAPASTPGLGPSLAVVGLVAVVAFTLLAAGAGAVVPLALCQGLAFAPVLGARGARAVAGTLLRFAAVIALAFVWHAAVGALVQRAGAQPLVTPLSWVATVGLLALATLQVLLRERPQSALARALQPRLFAGFSLDEYFTRLTFRLWPPQLPEAERARALLPSSEAR